MCQNYEHYKKSAWIIEHKKELTVMLNLNKWNELKSYILKASSLIFVGAQADFSDEKILENFLWALNDYISNAEKLIENINES